MQCRAASAIFALRDAVIVLAMIADSAITEAVQIEGKKNRICANLSILG